MLLITAINLLLGSTGFVSADEQVAHEQVDFLAEGRWVAPMPEPVIDPGGRWNPLNGVSNGDGVYAPYAKHPAFPLLLVPLDALAGRTGRFLTVGLGAVLSALVVGIGAERRRVGAGHPTFWLMLLGTPMLLHATVLWAHSLAIASAGLAMLGVQELYLVDRRTAQASAMIGAGLVGGVALRSDALLFFVLCGATIGLLGLRKRSWTEMCIGGGVAVTTVALYWLEARWRLEILGPSSSTGLSVPSEPMFDLEVRSVLVIKWLIGNDAGPIGTFRVLGLGIFLFELSRARRQAVGPRNIVLGIGVVCFVASLGAGSTYSFLVTAPLVILGLAMIQAFDRLVQFTAVLTITFFTAIVLTSYEAAGGGDWGGRYLSLLLAPLVMIAGPAVHRAWTDQRLRNVVIAGGVASMTIAAGILVHVRDARELSDQVLSDSIEQIGQISEPDAIVVITDARIARLLGETETDRRLFQVPPDELADFGSALGLDPIEIVVFDLMRPADLPAEWQVLEQQGSLRRVNT